MKKKSKVHMISGRTGSGKTTFAKKSEKELPAFRFSHDEMLVRLFGEKTKEEEFQNCCSRVNQLIWSQVSQLSKLGIDIVIEGWGSRKLRDQARIELDKLDLDYNFYYLDCPREIRHQRVKERNNNFDIEGIHISDEDFDRMEEIREEFDEDESCILIDTSSTTKTVVVIP